MKEVKVSIIICPKSPNGDLKRTLDSLLLQNFKNFEVIIVNKGCLIEINVLIEKYKKLFGGRMRHISLNNVELLEAINEGIKMAKGQYLTILEPGGELGFNSLELALRSANKYPQADVVYGVESIWERSKRIKGVVNIMAETLPIKNTHSSNLYYKKELHYKFGFYELDNKVIEDYAFCLKAFYLGEAIVRPFDLAIKE